MSFDPELYTLIHRGNPGDVAFYKKCCRGAATVLELGVGAGRIATELVASGHHVVGLDNHAGILELAERARARMPERDRARLELVQGDMRSFSLGRRFDRIIIPYNGLYCLLTEAELLGCFAAVARHLELDGQLVLDGYYVDEEEQEWDHSPDEHAVFLGSLTESDGRQIDIFEETEWQPEQQFMRVVYRHEIRQGDRAETVRYEIPQRYLKPDQLFAFAVAAGLEVLEMSVGFGDAEDDERQIVFRARPATSVA